MGTQLRELIDTKEVEITDLKGKVLAIDTSNTLYQFLSSIRGRDGSLLTDSHGNVTSHLQGLLLRTSNLLSKGILPCFVLDGKPPELKKGEAEKRAEVKREAEKKYKIAEKRKDLEEMKKYASRMTRLTPELIDEAAKLISAFGLPLVQAPSEAEAQAAFIVKNNDAYAAVSQDFDSLLHGATKLLRNLSIVGKRKRVGKLNYVTVKPELIVLSDVLNKLGIDQNQLIALGMLVGTDYNPGGIKGVGPINALKLVREFKTDFDALFKHVGWDTHFNFEWTEVYYLIKKMPVTKDYHLNWHGVDREKVIHLLCNEHDFSRERVEKTITPLIKTRKQKGLGDFL